MPHHSRRVPVSACQRRASPRPAARPGARERESKSWSAASCSPFPWERWKTRSTCSSSKGDRRTDEQRLHAGRVVLHRQRERGQDHGLLLLRGPDLPPVQSAEEPPAHDPRAAGSHQLRTEASTRGCVAYPFADIGEIAVASDKTLYVEDAVTDAKMVKDADRGVILSRVILRFDRKGKPAGIHRAGRHRRQAVSRSSPPCT